jgi:hypothetical protein
VPIEPKKAAVLEVLDDAWDQLHGVAEQDFHVWLAREPPSGGCMQRWLDLDRDDPTSMRDEKRDSVAAVRSRLDENAVPTGAE